MCIVCMHVFMGVGVGEDEVGDRWLLWSLTLRFIYLGRLSHWKLELADLASQAGQLALGNPLSVCGAVLPMWIFVWFWFCFSDRVLCVHVAFVCGCWRAEHQFSHLRGVFSNH